MNDDKELVFSIYSRPDCHLCDDMINALQEWRQRYNFKIKVINIDTNSELTKRYAARIPLLAIADKEICNYYLDEKLLVSYLENK
ncbi:MAG: glutaredoxin family protein [Pseudomonadota bacterium]